MGISARREALYELKAVEYAVHQNKLPPPGATLAGGAGSIQVTGLDNFFSFAAALKAGEKTVGGEGGVAAWQAEGQAQFSAAASAMPNFVKQIRATSASAEGGAHVVLISAFYYAALNAKLVDKKAQ